MKAMASSMGLDPTPLVKMGFDPATILAIFTFLKDHTTDFLAAYNALVALLAILFPPKP